MMCISLRSCHEAELKKLEIKQVQQRLIESSKLQCRMLMSLSESWDEAMVDASPAIKEMAEKQYELMISLGESKEDSREFVDSISQELLQKRADQK